MITETSLNQNCGKKNSECIMLRFESPSVYDQKVYILHSHQILRRATFRNRGSYMSAIVSLNLLSELGKRDKMRGLPSVLSLFRSEFNKFNYTRARMLDSIYHMTLRLL